MVYIADLPPHIQERVICSIEAANHYQLPANILLAVAEQENGRPGQWVKNTNGTHDVGTLQFNTSYIKTLNKYGITPATVAQSGCYPYYLAAWRIKNHVVYDKKGDIWTRVANYHSYTPKYNAIYRNKIIQKARGWTTWLEQRQGGVKPAIPENTKQAIKPSTRPVQAKTATGTTGTYTPRTIRVAID